MLGIFGNVSLVGLLNLIFAATNLSVIAGREIPGLQSGGAVRSNFRTSSLLLNNRVWLLSTLPTWTVNYTQH
jgi:hypothetical protein